MDDQHATAAGPAYGMEDPEGFAAGMYAALNRRDLEAFLAGVHPDVRFRSLIAESEASDFEGHAGVRRWFDEVASALGGMRFEPARMERHPNGLIIELTVGAVAQSTVVSQRMWQAVAMREGLCVWWHTYRTPTEAAEGLARAPARDCSG